MKKLNTIEIGDLVYNMAGDRRISLCLEPLLIFIGVTDGQIYSFHFTKNFNVFGLYEKTTDDPWTI